MSGAGGPAGPLTGERVQVSGAGGQLGGLLRPALTEAGAEGIGVGAH